MGGLAFGQDRYVAAVRAVLLSINPASIDQYSKPVKATDQICGGLLQESLTWVQGVDAMPELMGCCDVGFAEVFARGAVSVLGFCS